MTNRPFYFIMLGGFIFFLALVFLVGAKEEPKEEAAPAEEVQFDPAAQFAQSCAGCHGKDLQGMGNAPSLIGITLSTEEVMDIMANGRGQMPKGMFTGSDEEKRALAEWILQHK